jgi:hypothetical protein
MFGMTTTVVDTAAGPILQTPGAFYSNYYSHYLISVSVNGEFDLAAIGAGVSIGYTTVIDCTTGVGQLTVKAADTSVIAVLLAGDKLFLTATAATSSWKSSFAVPQGQNNLLLVYSGTYPRVQLLPVQKEISINGSSQYGVKFLTSFDSTEPAFWTAVAQTNLNRIGSLGNNNSVINTTGLTGAAVHTTISSNACNTTLTGISYSSVLASNTCTNNPSLSCTSLIAASNGSSATTAGAGTSAVIASDGSSATNPTGSVAIVGSRTATISNTTGVSSIIGSNTCVATQTGAGVSSIIGSRSANVNSNTTGVVGIDSSTTTVNVTNTTGIAGISHSSGTTLTNTSGVTMVEGSITCNAVSSGTCTAAIVGSQTSTVTTTGTGANSVISSTGSSVTSPNGIMTVIGCVNTSLTCNAQPAIMASIASTGCNFTSENLSIAAFIANVAASVSGIRGSPGLTLMGTNACLIIDFGAGTVTTPFSYSSMHSCISCTFISQVGATGKFTSSGVYASTSCNFINTGATVSADNFIGSSNNGNVVGSSQSTITSSTTGSIQNSTTSHVTAGDNNQCFTSVASLIGASNIGTHTSTIISSIISSDNASLTGDGINTFNPATGYANSRAGITILSSHSPIIATASDIRYCVIGGYNAATWSIDSKTGNFYGLGVFNAGTPLPGLAEMYENQVVGVIPYGRLLQLADGKVRPSTNGESGFMISRPYETAAFVGGNPVYDWPKKYLTDEFGLAIYQDYTKDEYIAMLKILGKTDEEIAKMEIGDVTHAKKLNPEYDPEQVYRPRSTRTDQWSTCEKSGIVVVEYSGSLSVGDYVVSAGEGIAKQANRKTNIKVIEIVDSSFAKVDIENAQYGEYVALGGSVAGFASLPAGISVRGVSFGDSSITLSETSKLKLIVEVGGDMMLATDLLVNLSDGTNTYWFSTTYARTSGSYKICSTLKSAIPAGEYRINFVTSKTPPTAYTGSLKLY